MNGAAVQHNHFVGQEREKCGLSTKSEVNRRKESKYNQVFLQNQMTFPFHGAKRNRATNADLEVRSWKDWYAGRGWMVRASEHKHGQSCPSCVVLVRSSTSTFQPEQIGRGVIPVLSLPVARRVLPLYALRYAFCDEVRLCWLDKSM